MMKRFFLLLLINSFIPVRAISSDTAHVNALHPHKINLFSLADVQLLDGDFKHIMDLDHNYLLSIDPDRLTSWFRREAGLTPKAYAIKLPADLINDQKDITIKLQAHRKQNTGNVYDLRIIKDAFKEAVVFE